MLNCHLTTFNQLNVDKLNAIQTCRNSDDEN